MKIYVTIPILHPAKSFVKTLIPLLQKQTVDLSLLFINSGKDALKVSQTEEILIPKYQFNHANTRNLALNYEADFYLFMTQDATPCDEYLVEHLLKAFEDPTVVVAYARQIPYENADAIEVFARTTNYPPISRVKSQSDLPVLGIKTFFCSDSCAMYRASYFQHVGGFKKDLNTNEDMEFAARTIMDGKKIAYVAEAKVYHSHRFTCKEIWRRYRAIGRFFKENSWLRDEVAKYGTIESSGIGQACDELHYLLQNAPRLLPRSILCSLIKFIAFKFSF